MSHDIRSLTTRGLMAALLGCTALAAVQPLAGHAQDGSIMLDTVTLEAGQGDNDATSIVATRTSAGGRMDNDVLDTAASVSVITEKEIQQRNAQSVEQVLQYSAGVSTDFYGSDDRFDFFKIRGFDAYTYRDGLPMGSAFGNVREEPFAFSRVEVLKGADSSSFGVSDPGGMVNYVTKTPKQERFGEAYISGGSNDLAEIGLDMGDKLTSDGTLSYRFTAKVRDAEKEYAYSRDDEKFLMGGLTWAPSDATSLTVVLDYLKLDSVPGSGGQPVGADLDRDTFLGEPDFNYRGTERTTLSMMFDHDFGGGLSFGANARYSDAKTDFGYAYVAGTVSEADTIASRYYFANESHTKDLVADARLKYDTSFGSTKSRTVAGVAYTDTKSDSATWFAPAANINWSNPVYSGGLDLSALDPYADTRTKNSTKAIYLQQELTFSDRFIATLGLRNDWLDLEEHDRRSDTTDSAELSETTSRLALVYKITPELSTYASYAESVVPASLGVEPEEGEQLEFGVKYRPAGSNTLLTASIYDLNKKNITRTDPITNLPSTIGEVRVRGLDLEAKAELVSGLSLTASYSFLDSEILENGTSAGKGNRMPFVSEHQASVWMNYEKPATETLGAMNFGLGARYTGDYYFDNANTQSTSGNVVFDAAYSYQVQENTEMALNVSNLFDDKHIAYGGFGADFYNPGRQIALTLRRTW